MINDSITLISRQDNYKRHMNKVKTIAYLPHTASSIISGLADMIICLFWFDLTIALKIISLGEFHGTAEVWQMFISIGINGIDFDLLYSGNLFNLIS